MAGLGCVKFCGAGTAGPRPRGNAGAAGITSAGTMMPGFADGDTAGGRAEPGRGGNADGDLAVAGTALVAVGATTGAAVAGARGERLLEGTPAYGSACAAATLGGAADRVGAATTGAGAATTGAGAATTGAGAATTGAGAATTGAGAATTGAGAATTGAGAALGVSNVFGAADGVGAGLGAADGVAAGAADAVGADDGVGGNDGAPGTIEAAAGPPLRWASDSVLSSVSGGALATRKRSFCLGSTAR